MSGQPQIPEELVPILRAHEVPHDTDAILWHIKKRGYHISLDGPDITKVNPDYRWTCRVYTNETDAYSYPIDREMVSGESARIALAYAFAWIVQRETAS